MGKRESRVGAVAGSLLAIACGLLGLACGSGDSPRLLLLLTSDTLRADRLGAYGSPLGITPALDALMQESTRFRFAFATTSYTLPSLSALMTGRYPEEIAMLENASRMGSDFATLASVLGLHRWRTGAVVSNYVVRKGTGLESGFELYDDTMEQREAYRDMPERTATQTTDAALRMLDQLLELEGQGAFLWVHYQDPHGPYLPPPGRRERFLEPERAARHGRQKLPKGRDSPDRGKAFHAHRGFSSIPLYQYVAGEHEVAFYRAGYDGEVSYLDDEVGRLLAGLEQRGLLERSIVVFTADHGEGLGEQDYWFSHGEYLTDPLVRVPLSLRIPGREPTERMDTASLVDLFPTLLALLGVEAPPGYPGRDLLAPDGSSLNPEIYLASLRGSTRPRLGLVADGYKYLVAKGPEDSEEALFRLGEEDDDRSLEEGARLEDMRRKLESFRAGLRRPSREHRQRLTPTERDRLRQLGYVVD